MEHLIGHGLEARATRATTREDANPQLLARLDPRLVSLLDAEVTAENKIASVNEWIYGKVEILVILAEPFKARPTVLPTGVKYEESRDQWLADGVLCDYWCEVATTGADDTPVHHVLRSIRK